VTGNYPIEWARLVARATLNFLWLRLARVWAGLPLVRGTAAAWIIFTALRRHERQRSPTSQRQISYVRQSC